MGANGTAAAEGRQLQIESEVPFGKALGYSHGR